MVKMLQTTTTTSGEMLASWVHPVLRRREKLGDATFIIVALLIGAPKRDVFIGQSTVNKTGLAIDTPYTTTIVTEVDNVAVKGLRVTHGVPCFLIGD